MEKITLYTDGFWISPFVFSVFVTLREKGLAFDSQLVSLQDRAQRKPDFLARSLTGRVPTLTHGDFSLAESTAIVEYLEDAFPAHPVLPTELRAKARARQVMGWLRSDLNPLREDRSTATMFYERADKPLTKAGEAAAEKLIQVSERLLPDGKSQLFSEFSIADADLAFMLQRLNLNGYALPERLKTFVEKVWARPSVQEFVNKARAPYVPY